MHMHLVTVHRSEKCTEKVIIVLSSHLAPSIRLSPSNILFYFPAAPQLCEIPKNKKSPYWDASTRRRSSARFQAIRQGSLAALLVIGGRIYLCSDSVRITCIVPMVRYLYNNQK